MSCPAVKSTGFGGKSGEAGAGLGAGGGSRIRGRVSLISLTPNQPMKATNSASRLVADEKIELVRAATHIAGCPQSYNFEHVIWALSMGMATIDADNLPQVAAKNRREGGKGDRD